MRKSIFAGFLAYLSVMVVVPVCRGEETAETVLARAESAYASSAGVIIEAFQREVGVSTRAMSPQQPTALGQTIRYSVLNLHHRNPDDWYVAGWGFFRSTGKMGSSMPPRPSAGYLLTKVGVNPGKLVSFTGGTLSKTVPPNPLTDEEFGNALHARLLRTYSGFPELAPLLSEPSKGTNHVSFGWIAPRLVGKEVWQGRSVYRIEATGGSNNPLIAWVDEKSGVIVRVVMQQGRGGGMFRMFTETIYKVNVDAKLGSFDFDPQPPAAAAEVLTDEQMGFGRSDDLAQYTGGLGGAPGDEPGRRTPAPSPVAPVVAPPAVAEQQALSPEQMAGIVLIDGDESTATGFMTTIKGVDFVVTNEHVLGENKKITLKNLRGEIIPVQAVYGAVGSDVAILRIGKAEGGLKLATDVLKSVKIGDKVVVVGNRLGGGVATQSSGQVLGVGPTRVEVNANFEPGNSGSPIFSLASNEVVGVATYAETRKVSVDDGASSARNDGSASGASKIEKRWFGYRLDGIAKWEAIDMARWRAQGERIDKFRDLSEALVAVIKLDFKTASDNEKLGPIIADFEAHAEQMRRDRVGIAGSVKDLMRTIRSIAEAGINDFSSAEYYDYYRTCLYWEESVPMQVDYRKDIVEVLKKYEANSAGYVSKMRNGG